MTRFSIFALALLTLVACRTEPTNGASEPDADPTESAAGPPMTDSTSGVVDLPAPRLDEDAETTSRPATLTNVLSQDGTCYVMASDEEGELFLMGTAEVCTAAAGLEGQRVVLTQGMGTQEVPVDGGIKEESVPMIVGIEAAQ